MPSLLRIASTGALLTASTAQALILYSGDNAANQTAPANGAPFDSVARVCNDGGGSTPGSAVHIRGKYMLTANHVGNRSHVTFDGSTYWARDTLFTPITIGSKDLKLFKLVEDPDLDENILHTSSSGNDVSYSSGQGNNQVNINVTGTLIGWGQGNAENGAGFIDGTDQTWTWSNPLAKRWGTNQIDAISNISSMTNYPYSYQSLRITLNTDAGQDEAGLAYLDSGSGIFVENGGVWTLAGIATLVSTSYSSTFSTSGDSNYFVRIQGSAAAIEAEIPDLTTLAGWRIDHSLYDTDADNTADTDFDGIAQLHEFAFGGDPNKSDSSILPTHALVEDGGNTYLELSVTRPQNLQGITYTPLTTAEMATWPSDSTGIVDDAPTPTDNGDGTETLIYRRSQAVSGTDQAFLRIAISETP